MPHAHNSFCLWTTTNLSDCVVRTVRNILNLSKQKRKKKCCEINRVDGITCKFSVSKNCQVLKLKLSNWYSWDLLTIGAYFTFVPVSDAGPSPHSVECCHKGHRVVYILKPKSFFFFPKAFYSWPLKSNSVLKLLLRNEINSKANN